MPEIVINVIIIIVILAIVGGAGFYLYRAKKRGEVCVGCPYAKLCAGKGCSCSHTNPELGHSEFDEISSAADTAEKAEDHTR